MSLFYFTLRSTVDDWGGPKNGQFWTKNAKHGSLSTFQSGPKGTKMVNPSAFDRVGAFRGDLGPFGPFQTKMNFLPQMDKVGFGGGASNTIDLTVD